MATDVTVEKSANTKFLEAAKDFSFDQKLSVVQSILAKIPREQQRPWNESQLAQKEATQETQKRPQTSNELNEKEDRNIEENDEGASPIESEAVKLVFQETDETNKPKPQPPPLIDPYEKSMRYYEKHLVLNHFQHMTSQLVLERPENTLQFMIDWCKDKQKIQEEARLKSKTLYEQSKIDVYDEDVTGSTQPTPTDKSQKSGSPTAYGTSLLKQIPTEDTKTETTVASSKLDNQEVQGGVLSNKASMISTDSGLGTSSYKKSTRRDNSKSTTAVSDDELSAVTDNEDSISVSSASEVL